jgi:DNA primase
MDDVTSIKSRLPIGQLVASYCALIKKGRNFVAMCPFHNDSHPSLLVSPDKGIAYCFACQSGGDIFSFYQKIEGVDFPQALKELAERAGVTLTQKTASGPAKSEKDRARECLSTALALYKQQLKTSQTTLDYLSKRKVSIEQIVEFDIGMAPDSFSATYEHLLKSGFSRSEIIAAGLGVQKDMQEGKIYDRFRNRLMFPIHDAQGGIVGFGGRTLGNDEAKYMNSSDGILFHKSNILYSLHRAKEAIRDQKNVILVEGYFDVLACNAVGVKNVVATCGTALTAEHVKILKRYTDTVTLCLDQDRAGREAMERSFPLLSSEYIQVNAIVMKGKDPSETLESDSEVLKQLLTSSARPYLETVIESVQSLDLSSPMVKREALQTFLHLLSSLPSAVERSDYVHKAAIAFQTTETALDEDLKQSALSVPVSVGVSAKQKQAEVKNTHEFSAQEIALGIFMLYPKLRHLLTELIPPHAGMPAALYAALKSFPENEKVTLDALHLSPEHHERASILLMFCEFHGFSEWSESLAVREIRSNCLSANREILRDKQMEVTKKLIDAKKLGYSDQESVLRAEYEEILKLMRRMK